MSTHVKALALALIVCIMMTMYPVVAEESFQDETLASAIEEQLTQSLEPEGYKVEVEVRRGYPASYLEEMEAKGRKTNYFGYYLEDVEEMMQGEKWVFTLGENGETVVQAFEPYDDTYEKALRNLAIGTGVILICVTVSVATGGIAPAVSAVFAVSAKTAALYGVSSGAIAGAMSGVITAYQTGGDVDAALKAAASNGSSAFLWGTITGAVTGGISEAASIHAATASGLSMDDVVRLERETGWSRETISRIKSMEEANIYKQANLTETVINNRTMLVRDIDLSYEEVPGLSNLNRMQHGLAPIDPVSHQSYELHHINQDPNGALAILTKAEHTQNASILNTAGKEGAQKILGDLWDKQRSAIWKEFARVIGG